MKDIKFTKEELIYLSELFAFGSFDISDGIREMNALDADSETFDKIIGVGYSIERKLSNVKLSVLSFK